MSCPYISDCDICAVLVANSDNIWPFFLHIYDVSSTYMRRGLNELGRPRQFPGSANNNTIPNPWSARNLTFWSGKGTRIGHGIEKI